MDICLAIAQSDNHPEEISWFDEHGNHVLLRANCDELQCSADMCPFLECICDGIICYAADLVPGPVLLSPLTEEILAVREPPKHERFECLSILYGVGYGDDGIYKIVCLKTGNEEINGGMVETRKSHVLTLGSAEWRTLQGDVNIPKGNTDVLNFETAVVEKGFLYWLVTTKCILAFDIKNETFSVEMLSFPVGAIYDFGGRVALRSDEKGPPQNLYIYVSGGYTEATGKINSWQKLPAINLADEFNNNYHRHMLNVLGPWHNDSVVVVLLLEERTFAYNYRTRTVTDLTHVWTRQTPVCRTMKISRQHERRLSDFVASSSAPPGQAYNTHRVGWIEDYENTPDEIEVDALEDGLVGEDGRGDDEQEEDGSDDFDDTLERRYEAARYVAGLMEEDENEIDEDEPEENEADESQDEDSSDSDGEMEESGGDADESQDEDPSDSDSEMEESGSEADGSQDEDPSDSDKSE